MTLQNLHCHTILSDGKLNHTQVLDVSAKLGIGITAFTDHDVLPDETTIELLNSYRSHPVKWIFGIELSSGWPTDLGGGAASGLHIVGLFVDPTNKDLTVYCQRALTARAERMAKMVKNLRGLGFDVTEKDCTDASRGEAIGRPHIVAAILSKDKNKTVIEKLRRKMELEAKNNPTIRKSYEEMIVEGEKEYPYVLFLSEDSFVKGIYVDYQYYADLDRSVSLIRNAGGVAVLAHWNSCRHKMNDDYIDKLLEANRIDGAETVYGLWMKKAGMWDKQEEELIIIKRLVNKHGKFESGGGDSHSAVDFELFSNEEWFSKRTVGMVEKIINSDKVDIKYSSLEK